MNVEETAFRLDIERAAEEDDAAGRPAFAREYAARPTDCRFDWENGLQGKRLRCVAHKHREHESTVIIRPGFDGLSDLQRLNLLVGEAAADAKNRASGQPGVPKGGLPESERAATYGAARHKDRGNGWQRPMTAVKGF